MDAPCFQIVFPVLMTMLKDGKGWPKKVWKDSYFHKRLKKKKKKKDLMTNTGQKMLR